MSDALDKQMDRIDKVCDCWKDSERLTVSVRGGPIEGPMFWVLACDDCAPLRRAAISREFPDVRMCPWPEHRSEVVAAPTAGQLDVFGGEVR